ncbi:MAG: 50S ribosomal protein L3 [Alphaproteobacteria bacterium]|jgi:large subunit ribosomal protein L3|nr:50S ribosomal protein L3 [Alphaproteobacteria bacterium]
MRVGLLAKKIGMSRIFDEYGDHYPVTVLECPEAVVLNAAHNAESNVKLASFESRKKSINLPQVKEFDKLKTAYRKHIAEFKVDDVSEFKSGRVITVDHFVEGQFVDARGKTIGKGFAGAMKRHGFAGLEATHGVSISHRSHGSTGQCQDPGRVFKGKKMAGHMGNTNVTIQNLQVMKIDTENALIFVKGALPGKKGTVVTLTDAVKRVSAKILPYPAGFKDVFEENQKPVEAAVKAEEVGSNEQDK